MPPPSVGSLDFFWDCHKAFTGAPPRVVAGIWDLKGLIWQGSGSLGLRRLRVVGSWRLADIFLP